MKEITDETKALLKDFADRKAFDPKSVIRVEGRDWEYIPVHPMANEIETLNKLGITQKECIQVDCYWRIGEEVFFLQVYTKKSGIILDTGFYARLSKGENPMTYLAACIEDEFITQDKVEKIMEWFDAYGIDNLRSDSLQFETYAPLPDAS